MCKISSWSSEEKTLGVKGLETRQRGSETVYVQVSSDVVIMFKYSFRFRFRCLFRASIH